MACQINFGSNLEKLLNKRPMKGDRKVMPMGWVSSIVQDINRFVNDMLRDTSFRMWMDVGDTLITVPAVNIKETDKSYIIEVAAPGMKKENFKVECEENTLIIRGEVKEEKSDEHSQYTRREFRFTSFERRFSLPDDANQEEIKAEYKDGLLVITIAKIATPPRKSKVIEIL